jgi:hypothetical protein
MEGIAEGAIELLKFLLPGFVAAWVFYGFSAHAKPNQFERIIQALIFTVLLQVFVWLIRQVLFLIGDLWFALGYWSEEVELGWFLVAAILFGLAATACVEHDLLHRLARRIGLTSCSSIASEWYGALAGYRGYLVLHLKDERRLYGYPKLWPEESEHGHFLMIRASWLANANGDEVKQDEMLERRILICAQDVKAIEFFPIDWSYG